MKQFLNGFPLRRFRLDIGMTDCNQCGKFLIFGNPEQFRKAVRMNLDKSDGLMVFDLVHIVNFGWWDDLAAAIRGL